MMKRATIEAQSLRWEQAKTPKEFPKSVLSEKDFARQGEFREVAVWCSGYTDFDCKTFKISPNEAKAIDPAIRMGIECTFEVLGQSRNVQGFEAKDVAVFFGISSQEYLFVLEQSRQAPPKLFWGNGNNKSVAANRLNYLTGTSASIDVACVSSLICLYFAQAELYQNLCSGAVVLGSFTISGEKNFDMYVQLHEYFSKRWAM